MRILDVALAARSYPIYIGPGLLQQGQLWQPHLGTGGTCIVTNETIGPRYLPAARTALPTPPLAVVELPDGERHKTLANVERIFDALMTAGAGRDVTLLALGGGVVGDMTGFAAACYQRGVRFLQFPTSLLAQVDSSVGGKTGVNHPLGKNMIGAFHQPAAVVIDTDTLTTLPARELRAGLAEVVKYGLIREPALFDWLEEHAGALLAGDADMLARAIETSCRIKAAVVAADEREAGERAILNLGHTFGHAIEAATGYSEWLHGEAVATGMLMAVDLSHRLGWLAAEHRQRLAQLLQALDLPLAPPALALSRWHELMGRDKKVLAGRLRLVLLRRWGHAITTADVDPAALDATLRAFGATAG